MPVDFVELVLKIPAINSSMREEFMVCKLEFEFCITITGLWHCEFLCSTCGTGVNRNGDKRFHLTPILIVDFSVLLWEI